jgi:uncharacterized membrane protein
VSDGALVALIVGALIAVVIVSLVVWITVFA